MVHRNQSTETIRRSSPSSFLPVTSLAMTTRMSERRQAHPFGKGSAKLQALVYDILPSTTAVFSYATGSRKLSANEQFFVDA